MDKKIIAICYDFDKTLACDDMQSFGFIPALGITKDEFWKKCGVFSQKNKSDPVLTYLRVMMDECNKKGISLTREFLGQMGKNIKFFDGVTTWFKRLNEHAKKNGIVLEHYVISSGNKEILEGCSIFKEFKNVFCCEYLYDKNGVAYWPKTVVNYTLKTQFLFRICKGAEKLTDDETVNQRVDKKHVEFANMIYIGDGVTDIPCMTLIKEKGGTAISVYDTGQKQRSVQLLKDNRVNYICKSDYRSGSELEKLMKLIIDSITLKEKLVDQEFKQSKGI